MNSALLHSSAHLPHPVALQVSQQALSFVQNTATSGTSLRLWSVAESPEIWTTYENLVLSCLRTGDEDTAKICLNRLTQRFGAENERLMALTGIFKEAVAQNDEELRRVLNEYDEILLQNPTNMPISKRRIALLKSLGKIAEAITSLNSFIKSSPTDAEAWSELSDLYVSQGIYQQAIFALEEVLLVTPYAWNVHARLGEVLYMAGDCSETGVDKLLAESVRRFCRSIELCDDYLRGYFGLKLVTNRILTGKQTACETSKVKYGTELLPAETKLIEKLNETATSKLSDIVRRNLGGQVGWQGYDKAEITAARELLNQEFDTSMTR